MIYFSKFHYCDDFIIGYERIDDAERVKSVLNKRFERSRMVELSTYGSGEGSG